MYLKHQITASELDITGTNAADFPPNTFIIGQTSQTKAQVVGAKDANTLYIARTQAVTAGKSYGFVAGETIQVGTSTAILSTIQTPEVNVNVGEVVYIENLTPVNRNISQTEDIKLVLEL